MRQRHPVYNEDGKSAWIGLEKAMHNERRYQCLSKAGGETDEAVPSKRKNKGYELFTTGYFIAVDNEVFISIVLRSEVKF